MERRLLELEQRVSKDRQKSHKPPSSDGLAAATRARNGNAATAQWGSDRTSGTYIGSGSDARCGGRPAFPTVCALWGRSDPNAGITTASVRLPAPPHASDRSSGGAGLLPALRPDHDGGVSRRGDGPDLIRASTARASHISADATLGTSGLDRRNVDRDHAAANRRSQSSGLGTGGRGRSRIRLGSGA